MYLLLYLGEVLVLVHVVLDLRLVHSCSFGSSAFLGEVTWFVTVVTLPDRGGRSLGVLSQLGRISLARLPFLFKLGHVSSALAGVGPRPSVGWRLPP